MEWFYAENPCPDCGSLGASFKFHGECELFGAEGEHMHRQCPACGYEWPERARQNLTAAIQPVDPQAQPGGRESGLAFNDGGGDLGV